MNTKYKKIQDISKMTELEIQAMIDKRVWCFKQSHANNKLEGVNLGNEYLKKLIKRAKLRISDKELKKIGMLKIAKKYNIDPKLLLDD